MEPSGADTNPSTAQQMSNSNASDAGSQQPKTSKTDKAFTPKKDPREIQVNRIKEISCANCGKVIDVRKLTPLSQKPCPECKTNFQVPCQIDQYVLIKRVASGAMGSVYVAYDEVLTRQIALKVIACPPSKDDDLYKGAVKEARIVAGLNHPNIAQIYSMGEDMGQPFITMELVDGGSGLDLIKKHGQVHVKTVLEYSIGACKALDYAYQLGYLHRDIKPGNILLNRRGEAKVIDWGLAARESQQIEGKVMGSPYYMAPEIARGKIADFRADIYSIGASMHHMLAGEAPFRAGSPKEVILKRFKENPADLYMEFGIDMHVAKIVAWTMNLNVEDRPESYKELIKELEKALANQQHINSHLGSRPSRSRTSSNDRNARSGTRDKNTRSGSRDRSNRRR